MNRQILNGWKEISGYIQRSVRTVQRWEAQMGMPVHRPAAKDSAVVVAFSDELDTWLHRSPAPARNTERPDQGLESLLEIASNLAADAAELSSRACMLQEQIRHFVPAPHRSYATRQQFRRKSPGRLLQFPPVSPAEIAR